MAPSAIVDTMGSASFPQDMNGVPTSPQFASSSQVGLGVCTWQSSTPSGLATFSLNILADGAADFAPFTRPAVADFVLDTIGDRSQFGCVEPTQDAINCYSSFTSDSYWIAAVYHTHGMGIPIETLSSQLTATFQGVAATLSALGAPLPRWTPPAALSGPATCRTLDPPGFAATAMSVTGSNVEVADLDTVGDDIPLLVYANAQSGLAGCEWTSVNTESVITFRASMTVLAGSLWAWESTDRSGWSPITVAGATEAFVHYTEQEAIIEILVNDSWVQASTSLGAEEQHRLITGLETMVPNLPIVRT